MSFLSSLREKLSRKREEKKFFEEGRRIRERMELRERMESLSEKLKSLEEKKKYYDLVRKEKELKRKVWQAEHPIAAKMISGFSNLTTVSDKRKIIVRPVRRVSSVKRVRPTKFKKKKKIKIGVVKGKNSKVDFDKDFSKFIFG